MKITNEVSKFKVNYCNFKFDENETIVERNIKGYILMHYVWL